ncbi:MAG: GGDEF domain-containing protein [Oscillospiraceae bacterium]|jgi:diguanylate cyclase (GGDEF)-like protein|nr:GGDEF domain-containing protein [Oscillospiraceae bacterium]
MEPRQAKKSGKAAGKGRMFTRFRNANILLFTLAFCILAGVMAFAFEGIVTKTSAEYAGRYASSSAGAFAARIDKEISLMSKAAHSPAVTEWLADESDGAKKARAYAELAGVVGELYSFNLYVGSESSLNEYRVETDYNADRIEPVAVLNADNPQDGWYFECVSSDGDYILSIDIDHIMRRKRVWLDYKVLRDGVILGVICTGLEFSHVVGELFSHYESNFLRGLIIGANGAIHMDSARMDDRDFLYSLTESTVEDEFSDPKILSAVRSYMEGNGPAEVRLSSGPYRRMTITPIAGSGWAVVILSGSSSLFDISVFIPLTVTVLVLLLAFALFTSTANYRLFFRPLGYLDRSLAEMKENNIELIYGLDRDDELGHLSQTIRDLFTKANVDALTGIYNRRFMENNLEHIMEALSRSGGMLGILMIDIDFFKKYNDAYGHEQGDVCLRSVAGAVAAAAGRSGDFAARYGGEEFVVALPNTDENGACVIAGKLLEGVRGLNIPHPDNASAPCVTVSVGVTTGKVAYMQTWEDYVQRADEALYASKQSGRNRYTYKAF